MKDEQVEEAPGYKLKDRRIGGKESMKEYNDDELKRNQCFYTSS